MRLKIKLNSDGIIILPIHYYSILQGFIYSIIYDKSLQDFLHNKGYSFEKRKFKPFTFSNIQGNYKIKQGNFIFFPPIEIILSTSMSELAKAIVETFVHTGNLYLGKNNISIESINLMSDPEFDKVSELITLSPITVYSTLTNENGKKFTRYYDKKDPEFERLIFENLIKKAKSVCGLDLTDDKFKLINIGNYNSKDQKSIKFKGFSIKAWHGRFKIETTPELKEIAYELGLGSKNAQGFGCIKFIENKL